MTNQAAARQTHEKIAYIWDENRYNTDKRPWIGELPAPKTDFTFAVFGDRCGLTTPGIFEQAVSLVKQLKPDFAIGVGDLVEGYVDEEDQAHEEWLYMETLLQSMNVPFFPTVGNHDYGSPMMMKVYHDRKGFEYYAIRYAGALFLFLNTEETPKTMADEERTGFRHMVELSKTDPQRVADMIRAYYAEAAEQGQEPAAARQSSVSADIMMTAISDEQLAFFEQVLAEHADAAWTFVNMHVPAWKADSPQFARLEAMLGTRSYTMFAGHLHVLELSEKDGRHRIQMGRTGAVQHGAGKGNSNHILWVSVEGGKPTFTVIELGGTSDILDYGQA